jgi:cytidine deaminase
MRRQELAMAKVGKNERRLLKAAFKGMHKAHVLCGFKVGAAVLGEDGNIYEGCNVESWVSGLGTCAERCAINHAILHGNRRIKEVAILMNADRHVEPRPCGACLQYIYDLAVNSKIKIIMAKAKGRKILFQNVDVKTLEERLPFPYDK